MKYAPFFLFGGIGLFLLIYNNLHQKRSVAFWETPIDRATPFIPAFIVPYLLYFPFIFVTFGALRESLYEVGFLAATNLSLYSSLLIYYFFPSSIRRPALPEEKRRDLFEALVALVYKIDRTTNGLPSAHVYVSFICGYYLMLAFPSSAVLIWSVAGGIIASTTFVKQHYVIDIFGGVLWGLGSILLVNWMF